MTDNTSLNQPNPEHLDFVENGAAQGPGNVSTQTERSPARLHWSSLFFDIISHSRNYLIPAVIALFSAARGNSWGVIFAGSFFFPSLTVSLFRYFTLKYRVHGRQLVVEQGMIFRSVRTIPVERIQNIDMVQNVLHRMFQVGEVRIETASGSEPEAVLRVLTLRQVEQLRGEVFGARTEDETSNSVNLEFGTERSQHSEIDVPTSSVLSDVEFERPSLSIRNQTSAPRTVLVEMKLVWLVLAGLASNRGMIMVGIGIGLLYQTELMETELMKKIDFKWLQSLFLKNFGKTVIIGLGLLGFLILMILLRILGVGWYILRFFGYQLTSRGEDLQISCGLLTKVSASVPRKRIQLVSIHQNLILKWMRLTSLRIETAGGTSDQEDASKSVSRRWFLPVIPESELSRLLSYLRPDFNWQLEDAQWIKVAPRAFARKSRMFVTLSILIGAAAGYFLPPWGWALGLAALIFFLTLAFLDLKSISYARLSEGIVLKSGFFSRKTSYTFLDKLQTFRVDQSPFDKRWKMASLTIDTAGAGPSEHALVLSMFESDFVIQELHALKSLAARRQPDFRGRFSGTSVEKLKTGV